MARVAHSNLIDSLRGRLAINIETKGRGRKKRWMADAKKRLAAHLYKERRKESLLRQPGDRPLAMIKGRRSAVQAREEKIKRL
jgi:hypothetical protein